MILPASEVSLTIPADFPEALAKAVGPTFRNKTELKSVHPQFYQRKPNLLRQVELSKEEKVDILGMTHTYDSCRMSHRLTNI